MYNFIFELIVVIYSDFNIDFKTYDEYEIDDDLVLIGSTFETTVCIHKTSFSNLERKIAKGNVLIHKDNIKLFDFKNIVGCTYFCKVDENVLVELDHEIIVDDEHGGFINLGNILVFKSF